MRFSRRNPLFAIVLLCAAAVLQAPPTVADSDGGEAAGAPGEAGISARVVRLFDEAAVATQRYEAGRRAAVALKTKAERLEKLLAREQKRTVVLNADLGRLARAQYREGRRGAVHRADAARG